MCQALFSALLPIVWLKNWSAKVPSWRVSRGSLTARIHTDEDWSPGDLFKFNEDEAVCPLN